MRKDCIWKWEDAWGSIAWSRRSEARLVLEHKGWVSGNGGNEAMVGRSQILNNCINDQLHMPYLATADHSLCLETPSPWLPGYHSLLVSLLPYSGHSSVLFLTFAFYTTYKLSAFLRTQCWGLFSYSTHSFRWFSFLLRLPLLPPCRWHTNLSSRPVSPVCAASPLGYLAGIKLTMSKAKFNISTPLNLHHHLFYFRLHCLPSSSGPKPGSHPLFVSPSVTSNVNNHQGLSFSLLSISWFYFLSTPVRNWIILQLHQLEGRPQDPDEDATHQTTWFISFMRSRVTVPDIWLQKCELMNAFCSIKFVVICYVAIEN